MLYLADINQCSDKCVCVFCLVSVALNGFPLAK